MICALHFFIRFKAKSHNSYSNLHHVFAAYIHACYVGQKHPPPFLTYNPICTSDIFGIVMNFFYINIVLDFLHLLKNFSVDYLIAPVSARRIQVSVISCNIENNT